MEAPMGLKPTFEERQGAAHADLHLDTANRCLVRQLRALSRLGAHSQDLKLAEAVLKTMLDTHETMVETHELLVQTKERNELRARGDAMRSTARQGSPSKPGSDQEATWLLRSKRLQRSLIHSVAADNASDFS